MHGSLGGPSDPTPYDQVSPTTYALPASSTATSLIQSSNRPPKYVEKSSFEPLLSRGAAAALWLATRGARRENNVASTIKARRRALRSTFIPSIHLVTG